MKKIFIISSLIATTLATPSFAAPTELDKKTVASKAYVDTKQDMIPAAEEDYQSVLTDTDNDGVVGKMQIITADYTFSNNLALEDLPGTIPTSDAVFSELDNYWQPKITTGLVEFEGDDATINVPSVVTTNAAGTKLTGNQIGFMTLSAFAPTASPFLDFKDRDDGDSFVPSAALVAMGFDDMYNTLTNMFYNFTSSYLAWDSPKHTAAINAYNTTFGNGQNQWAGDSSYMINGQFLANSLALKQNKIPAGTAGNVVTYSGTAGTVGSVATANAPTYNETTGVLENGTNIATIAAVDTRQKKMTCAGWDSETHTDEHCWLWSIE